MTEDENIRSHEERQISTFKHKPVERVVWQPRFSDWYYQNHIPQLKKSMSEEEIAKFNLRCPDLPKDIFGMEHSEIFQYLSASARYIEEIYPMLGLFYWVKGKELNIEHK